jgi:hypothetical protein
MRSLPVAQQGPLDSPSQSSQMSPTPPPSDRTAARAPKVMLVYGKEVEVPHILVMAQAGFSLAMMFTLYCSGL